MPLIETLGILITSATAKTVVKFVDEKISDYIRQKFGNKPSPEIAAMKKEIEDLKSKLDAKEKNDITTAEVDELRVKVTQIEQMHSALPSNIISGDIFQAWSEKGELDIEDQALIIRKQLEILMDKAGALGLKPEKRHRIQDKATSIIVTTKNLRESREKARDSDLTKDKEEVVRLERLLQNIVFQSRDLLKGY